MLGIFTPNLYDPVLGFETISLPLECATWEVLTLSKAKVEKGPPSSEALVLSLAFPLLKLYNFEQFFRGLIEEMECGFLSECRQVIPVNIWGSLLK